MKRLCRHCKRELPVNAFADYRYKTNTCTECRNGMSRIRNEEWRKKHPRGARKEDEPLIDESLSWHGRGYDPAYVQMRDNLLIAHAERVQAERKKKPCRGIVGKAIDDCGAS